MSFAWCSLHRRQRSCDWDCPVSVAHFAPLFLSVTSLRLMQCSVILPPSTRCPRFFPLVPATCTPVPHSLITPHPPPPVLARLSMFLRVIALQPESETVPEPDLDLWTSSYVCLDVLLFNVSLCLITESLSCSCLSSLPHTYLMIGPVSDLLLCKLYNLHIDINNFC